MFMRVCGQPGCTVLVVRGRCPAHTRAPFESATRTHQGLYQTARWQSARAGFLDHHPWCVECEANGQTVIATTVDHIDPEAGFWDRTNWQALCADHHNTKSARYANTRLHAHAQG